jgi:hypothetical protein
MIFRMFSNDALKKFAVFCEAANLKVPRPQGAFDQAMKPTKGTTMSANKYVPVKGTANTLFTRERSNVMAYDDVEGPDGQAGKILEFLHDKISEDDYARIKEMLQIEAGEPVDSQKQAEKMNAAARSRGAQDSAPSSSFDKRFPSAKRIGTDPGYDFR